MVTLKNTLSVCPVCLKVISAKTIEQGDVFIEKKCAEHGDFRHKHIWDKKDIYTRLTGFRKLPTLQNPGLVINLTTDCNMSCPFCFAHANETEARELTPKEIDSFLSDYEGSLVYISGGEPTTSTHLLSLIKRLKSRKYTVGLFTNGKKLQDYSYVSALKKAGVDFIILQFDSLKDRTYEFLRGEPMAEVKTKVIENMSKHKIPVYLFVMLTKEKNFCEISDLIHLTRRYSFARIINFNPVWETGRRPPHNPVTSSEILREISAQTGIETEDFLSCTEFAYLFHYLLSRISKKITHIMQPLCELRCYVLWDNPRPIPLSKILNIRKINRLLNSVAGLQNRKPGTYLLRYYSLSLLLAEFSASFCGNRNFRKLALSFIKMMLLKKTGISFLKDTPLTSIIIGTFQTAENLDFDMLNSCNLYSDFIPESAQTYSACVRQIIFNHTLSGNSLSGETDKLLIRYKNTGIRQSYHS